MSRARLEGSVQVVVLLAALAAASCGSTKSAGAPCEQDDDCTSGSCIDGRCASSGPRDGGSGGGDSARPGQDGGGREDGGAPPGSGCTSLADCDAGEVCLGGACQPDPCTSAPAGLCGEGTSCHATCVATSDPCAGVTCAPSETCVDGTCVRGCFVVP